MAEVKNILLIGRSGRGKSTLANVILNKNGQFEEIFKESSKSVSETKEIQSELFEDNNVNYLVIDTPGIGDTKMSDNEVLDIIAKAVYQVRSGISQVLFVVDGRFDKYEMATYNLLRTIIFDDNITKHTTIIRTNFANFRKKERCQEDIDSMKERTQKTKTGLEKKLADKGKEKSKLEEEGVSRSSKEYKELEVEFKQLNKELKSTLSEIMESCCGRVIHVDNPPISGEDSDSGKRIRKISRKKILEHLGKSCQGDYKPSKLKELSDNIADDYFQYMKKKEDLEEEMKKIKTSSTDTQSPKIEDNGDKLENVSEAEDIKGNDQELADMEGNDDLAIGEKITQLEDKKAKLKKEIAEKERIIRQKVLKHIFNNIDNISNELGGDFFMESVVGEHSWEKISREFSNKVLVVKWLNEKFDYEQVQKWATVLGNEFDPKNDAGFCAWLRDNKQLIVEKIKGLSQIYNIKLLRGEYVDRLLKETKLLEEHNKNLVQEKEEWKSTNSIFKEKGYNEVGNFYWDDFFSNYIWDITDTEMWSKRNILTPPLTLKKVEVITKPIGAYPFDIKEEGKTYTIYLNCLTFKEKIKYSDEVFNTMYFPRFAMDFNVSNSNVKMDADCFFYFITKLGQKVQIPLRIFDRMLKKDCSLWILSDDDDVYNEILEERSKWEKLNLVDEINCLTWENKQLVDNKYQEAQVQVFPKGK